MNDPKKSSPSYARWLDAHLECERLADEAALAPEDKRRALARARQCEVHLRLGFASFDEYVDFLFGRSLDDDDDEADP